MANPYGPGGGFPPPGGGYPPPGGGYPPPGQNPYGVAQPPYPGAPPPPGVNPYGPGGGVPPGQNPYGPPSQNWNANPYYQQSRAPYHPPPQPGWGQHPPPPPHPGAPPPQHAAPQHAAPPNAAGQPSAHQVKGKRRAFIVGINYLNNSRLRLNGCINDARCLKYLLTSKLNFQENQILFMTDDQQNPTLQPTRANIMQGIRWLVGDAKPGDSLFFSYSGHGSQVKDLDGDEADGMDETIVPLDYERAGHIIDDDLKRYMADALPAGARLFCVMDCCHSGTGMDLPYEYQPFKNDPSAQQPLSPIDMLLGGGRRKRGRRQQVTNPHRPTQADVVLVSACGSDQTSADTKGLSGSVHTGAMTYSFIDVIEKKYPGVTLRQLIHEMHNVVMSRQSRLNQRPELSTGKILNLDLPFYI
eukprot:Clim_evm19s166 gene=Clim_evmTU19s166